MYVLCRCNRKVFQADVNVKLFQKVGLIHLLVSLNYSESSGSVEEEMWVRVLKFLFQ